MVYQPSFISVNLATTCLESFLLYGTSTYLLVSRGREQLVSSGAGPPSIFRAPMFIAANIIFCSVTGHWVCTVTRLFDAFMNYKGGSDPLYIYANLALATEVIKSAMLVATLVTSDATIIYRLYIIWGYNKWIVVFPTATWLALAVCGSGVSWQFSQYKFGEDVYTSLAGRWITSDCVFTFSTNIYCSALISWRVWRSSFRTQTHARSNILGALAIVVESALLNTAWNLVFFVCYQLETNLQFTAIDLWSPVCGIAFMLINLRVALGWAQRAHSHSLSQSTLATVPVFAAQSQSQPGSPLHGRPYSQQYQYPLQVVAVKVTQVVDRVRDSGASPVKEDADSEDGVFAV